MSGVIRTPLYDSPPMKEEPQMSRPEPNYPKRSAEGVVRHAKKRHVRGAYLDPMPKRKGKRG